MVGVEKDVGVLETRNGAQVHVSAAESALIILTILNK
jgi:hypothetical protein